MYAVLETGGKQYRVSVGSNLKVEKLTCSIGETVNFDRILLLSADEAIQTGDPLIKGASVKAQVVGHGRAKKIEIFKMKRRKKYRRKQGPRQGVTELHITDIISQ